VLELGMFLSKLGRKKVAILLKEAVDFERPSDIQGLVYIPFQNRVDEVSINLIRELTRQGYVIDSTRI
jgi:predicted nucleotide-binding protein